MGASVDASRFVTRGKILLLRTGRSSGDDGDGATCSASLSGIFGVFLRRFGARGGATSGML